MRGVRASVGMGVSAALWAAVTFAPRDLAREKPPLPEEAVPQPPPVPDQGALREVDARLAEGLPALEVEPRQRLAEAVVHEAEASNLDPLLVLAVIEVESSFDADALSGAGARGLMQLREPTLRRELRKSGIEGNPLDPVTNVQAGVRYLRRLMDEFPGVDLALMAYNAGPNRILGYLRAGEVPDRFHRYPRRVKAVLKRLRKEAYPMARLAAVRHTAEEPSPPAFPD